MIHGSYSLANPPSAAAFGPRNRVGEGQLLVRCSIPSTVAQLHAILYELDERCDHLPGMDHQQVAKPVKASKRSQSAGRTGP